MLFQRDEAMTKWWVKLTLAVFFTGALSAHIEPVLCFIKGVCASSSVCIFVGYYVFTIIYNIHNEPHLMKQLYLSQNLETSITFPNYFLLDTYIHVGLPIFVFYNWHGHITIPGAIVAFLFHRYWSLLNSDFTSIYLEGHDIYKVKGVSSWGWPVVYVGEAAVLVIGTAIAFYLRN